MRDMTAGTASIHTAAAALALALVLSGPPTAGAQPAGNVAEPAQSGDPAASSTDDRNVDTGEDNRNEQGNGEGVVLSPFDYEASESISEDASVSFPVDI